MLTPSYPSLKWTWGPVQVRAIPDQRGGYQMQTYRDGKRIDMTANLHVPSPRAGMTLCRDAAHDLAERVLRGTV